jgi:hypothetical protein
MESRNGSPELSSALRALAGLIALLSLAVFVGACALALASVFAFDAPGSERRVLLWLFVLGAWVAPLAFLIAALAAAFAAFSAKRRPLRVALACLLAPALYLAVVGALLWFAYR